MKGILNRFLIFIALLLTLREVGAFESHCTALDTHLEHTEELLSCKKKDACTWDDWVVSSDPENLCQGYYLELPVPPSVNLSVPQENQPIQATSDRGEFTLSGNSLLSGHVHLLQGQRQGFATEVQLLRNSQGAIETIVAKKAVRLVEPQIRLDAEAGRWDVPNDKQSFEKGCFRLYPRHVRGTADTLEMRKKTYIDLTNATYTTCAPCRNTWFLKAKKVHLNRASGRGKAYHTKMYFKNIPIAYLPYINFPIDDRRQTGFLFPTLTSTNQSGMEFSLPFYWNIAPNYDALVTPRYLSERGTELESVFRYLSASSQGTLNLALLPHDRKYQNFRKEKTLNPAFSRLDQRVTALNKSATRTVFHANHTTSFSPNTLFNLNYLTVSDDNYFMDLGKHFGVGATTQLLQKAEMVYQNDHWNGFARLQKYQTLHPYDGPLSTDVYASLPQLALKSDYPDLPYGLHFTAGSDFTHFSHKPAPITRNRFTEGTRAFIRPGIALPYITPSVFIIPRLQYHIISYHLSLATQEHSFHQPKNPTLAIPIFDLNTGLIFERPLTIYNENYIQTLEPRAYYLYVPYRNQNQLPNFDTTAIAFDYNQLYRFNRFSGLDRIGDANQLTLGVETRFLNQDTGEEQLSLGIGQSVYFQKQRVKVGESTLDLHSAPLSQKSSAFSDLAGMARYHFNNQITAISDIEWHVPTKQITKGAFYFQYHPEPLKVFNIGYQFLKKTSMQLNIGGKLKNQLHQVDTSFAVALNSEWRFLARCNYDIHNHRSNDLLAGIEQQGCCTAVRLSVNRFILPFETNKRHAYGIFLQFVFKGLAGVGHQMTPTLKDSIPGYEWRGEDF